MRSVSIALSAVLALGGAASAGVVYAMSSSAGTSPASSSGAGSDPAVLVMNPVPPGPASAAGTAVPAPENASRAPSSSSGPQPWRSHGKVVGAQIELTWSSATRVDHVDIQGADAAAERVKSFILSLPGTNALLLTADAHGDISVSFPPREVTEATLTVAEAARGATSAAVAGVTVDGIGSSLDAADNATASTSTTSAPGTTTSDSSIPPATPRVTVSPAGGGPAGSASSSRNGPTSSLVDGALANADTGQEWEAAPDDAAPWVKLTWSSPRQLASVQIFGPSEAAGDWTTAQLHGLLRFDDGSTVVVSGIAGGQGAPTTIAFTPRMTTSVRLELARTVPTSVVGLREFVAYEAGTTPPRWRPAAGGPALTVTAPPAVCGSTNTPVAGRLTLVCPAPGSAVTGLTRIVVATDPGTTVHATAWKPAPTGAGGELAPVAEGTAGADGRAELTVDTSVLQRGPLTVRVTSPGASAPLDVQLVNRVGKAVSSAGDAPAGMTLQWDDEFKDPLSASATGSGADYATAKPEPGGASQFGDAVFAPPGAGTDTLGTLDGDYLRIRVEPIAGRAVNATWGQQHLGGLLSSLHIGASGFAAQYGYFEARMMGAPGLGSWPAFWMLNSEAAARNTGTSAEVDAVELYGNAPDGSCHTTHNWGTRTKDTGVAHCQAHNGFSDWTMTWHNYGVRIVPGGALFYIDGVQVAAYTGLTHTEEPFFFLVDLALGGGWPVDLASTGNTTDLYVDWIHAYT